MVSGDEQAFALDLLRRLGPGQANLVMSPSSLAALLAMVEPGTAGSTEAGIAEALHASNLSAAGQSAGWRDLEASLAASARRGHVTLETANEAWLQDGLPVRPAYLNLLARDFAAHVSEADFAHDPATAAGRINSWVSSHTAGHITRLVDASQLEDMVAVLVDAVYMDARWARAFPTSLTAPASFHISTATSVQVPMMSSGHGGDFRVLVGRTPSCRAAVCPHGFEAALLPYSGGQLSALLLMPPLGDLHPFESKLTPAVVAQVVASLHQEPALVELPKFSLGSELNLKGVLSAMGMGEAFTPSADFSNLSPEPLQLGFVVHDAQMNVTEEGTEASAASGAGVMPTAVAVPAEPQLVFNHPFLLLVRDDATGTVLFEAQVGNPAAS